MKKWLIPSLLIGLMFGCDSESKKTYEFTGIWTFSGQPRLCKQYLSDDYGGGELEFDEIVIKVYENEKSQEEGDVLVEETVPCSAGSFTIDDLARGTYIVNVQAMAMDPVIEEEDALTDAGTGEEEETESSEREVRAYYESTKEVVVPPKEDEQVKFSMEWGTGSIEVNWSFVNGLMCGAAMNNVEKVEVEIIGEKSGDSYNSEKLDCTEGSWKAEDLIWDEYTITVLGYNEDGDQTHVGSLETPLEIRPGTHLTGEDGVIIKLEAIED